MKFILSVSIIFVLYLLSGCNPDIDQLKIEVFETSANGNKLQPVTEFNTVDEPPAIRIYPDEE